MLVGSVRFKSSKDHGGILLKSNHKPFWVEQSPHELKRMTEHLWLKLTKERFWIHGCSQSLQWLDHAEKTREMVERTSKCQSTQDQVPTEPSSPHTIKSRHFPYKHIGREKKECLQLVYNISCDLLTQRPTFFLKSSLLSLHSFCNKDETRTSEKYVTDYLLREPSMTW